MIRHKPLFIKLLLLVMLALYMLFFTDNIFAYDSKIYSHYTPIKLFIATLCFGVIFSAAIYNLALYIYNRDKRYLYYSLGQLSVLLFLANLDALHIAPLNEIFTFKSFLLYDLSQIFVLLFSTLFIKYFLGITKEHKILDILIKSVIVLALLDIVLTLIFSHSILTRIFPVFVPIWLIITESKRLYPHKDRAFYFFYYGWSMVIMMAMFVYLNLTSYFNMDFPFLHTIFAFESMILSLAIAYKMKLLEEQRILQQGLLLQQSRLASMGEMIATIAHQWRQPLTHLSYLFMNLGKKADDANFVTKKVEEGKTQLRYMTQTIEDFSTFYSPSKQKENFSLQDAADKALTILAGSLSQTDINVTIECKEDASIFGNSNEFQQLLLTLLNNAKDALISRNITNPTITIFIDRYTIMIGDNAGGIEKEHLNKIFEPYFSTKEKSDGIGLYIAKTIVETKMQGTLRVKNHENGALFTITLPNHLEKI